MAYYPEKADWIDQLANRSFKSIDILRKKAGKMKALQGAQYLCIADGLGICMGEKRLYHSQPAQKMELYNLYTLGHFILNFVDWQNGRPISLEEDCNNDPWSSFIWELIHRTMANPFNRRNVGMQNKSRTSGDFFTSLLSEVKIADVDDWENTVEYGMVYSNDEYDGISILCIDEDVKRDRND